jgi:hypothetical protein
MLWTKFSMDEKNTIIWNGLKKWAVFFSWQIFYFPSFKAHFPLKKKKKNRFKS